MLDLMEERDMLPTSPENCGLQNNLSNNYLGYNRASP